MRKTMPWMKTLILFVLLALGACRPQPWIRPTSGTLSAKVPTTAAALRQELAMRVGKDQAIRARFTDAQPPRVLIDEMLQIDAENTAWLKQVVAQFGWPTQSLVGAEGADNAWLLVQHADQDLAFQQMCLTLMKGLLNRGEVSKANYAYLYDRVAVGEGRPQRYGTQGTCTAPHTWELAPLEDAAQVEQLRRDVGLEPLEEYQKGFYSICP